VEVQSVDGIVARARAGLVALLMLGATDCGGDDDEGSVLPDDAAESNAGGGDSGASEDVDVCSLLEQADVEAEFGDRGSVTQESSGCDWQVGEFGRSGTGTVNVVNTRTIGPIEEDYDIAWDVADHPVAVEGVGDEAFFDLADPLGSGEFTSDDSSASLTFRTGDLLVMVQANFFDLEVDPEQERERLITLAERMLDRL
jgi:hypothetical protein